MLGAIRRMDPSRCDPHLDIPSVLVDLRRPGEAQDLIHQGLQDLGGLLDMIITIRRINSTIDLILICIQRNVSLLCEDQSLCQVHRHDPFLVNPRITYDRTTLQVVRARN